MRILVVNLLRIGDIILSTPVLQGLREKHPDAEIHLLINRQCQAVVPMLKGVDCVHYFERTLVQNSLGESDRTMFEGFDRVRSLVSELDSQEFSLLVNLTQNRLSAWLCGLLHVPQILGLHFDDRGLPQFGSRWFKYLNDQAEWEGERAFHFADVFLYGAGLKNFRGSISLKATESGRLEARRLLEHVEDFMVVQPLTSDSKKNWGLENFRKLIVSLREKFSNLTILVLSSPEEATLLQPWVNGIVDSGVQLAVCSLEGALSLLEQAKLLVTGDTSIKHIGVAARVPIVELSLGSSDLFRTGPYTKGAYIVRSKESCVPCVHSQPCHRTEQFCAKSILPEIVELVVSQILRGQHHSLRNVAEEFADEVAVFKTELDAAGFYSCHQLNEQWNETSISNLFERVSWKVLLQEAQVKTVENLGEYGSESFRLGEALKSRFPEVPTVDWRNMFSDVEGRTEKMVFRLDGFRQRLKKVAAKYDDKKEIADFVDGLQRLALEMNGHPLLRFHAEEIQALTCDLHELPFLRLRRLSSVLEDVFRRADIELKMLRNLRSQMEMVE